MSLYDFLSRKRWMSGNAWDVIMDSLRPLVLPWKLVTNNYDHPNKKLIFQKVIWSEDGN